MNNIAAVVVLAVAFIAAAAIIFSIITEGRKERRQLQARIASVSPAQAPIRKIMSAQMRASLVTRMLAPVFDPILRIDRRIAADEPMPIIPFVLIGIVAGAAIFLVLTGLFGLPLYVCAPVAAFVGVYAARMMVSSRRDSLLIRMEDEFQLALGVIIRCVRAGLPVTEGMRAVAGEVPPPTGPELKRCVDQIQLGEDFDMALSKLADRCAIADYRFFGTAVTLQRQTGGNLTETLDNLSETVRRRKAVRLKAQALTSEARATITVLAILPFAVSVILYFVNQDYVMQLFNTASGRVVLGVAIGIQSFGLYIVRVIIKRSLA